jgi:hypothetical protein
MRRKVESLAAAAAASEKIILGALVVESERFAEVKLCVDDFGAEAHRHIYDALVELAAHGEAWDLVLVAEALQRRGHLARIGGAAYLASLSEGLPRRVRFEEHVAQIRSAGLRRKLATFAERLTAASDDASETPASIILRVDAEFASIRSAASGTASGPKLVRIGELMARPLTATDWVWAERLAAGSLSILVAKPKSGKSTLARNVALAVSRGELCLGWATKRTSVCYFSLEERCEDVVADFRAMGANGEEDLHIAEAATVADVLAVMEQRKPGLIVIDPLFRLNAVKDERAYAETYSALGPLVDACRSSNAHILLVHHSSKIAKAEAIDSPLGSTALAGVVGSVLVVRRSENFRTLETVQRVGCDLEETVLGFDPATKLLCIRGTRDEAEIRQVESGILAHLTAGGAWSEPEVVDATEGRNEYKRRALRQLVAAGKVSRSGSGRRGDPFRYEKACTLVPDPAKNSGYEKPTDNIPEQSGETEKLLAPTIFYSGGETGTRNKAGLGSAENVGEKLVPDHSVISHREKPRGYKKPVPDEVRL